MDWQQLRDAAAGMADKVVNATEEIVEKGKKQVDILGLENKLAKVQRQLGALVYSLSQSGTDRPELVAKYIHEISQLEQQIQDASGKKNRSVTVSPKVVRVCTKCKQKVTDDAKYCPMCGEIL